MRNITICLALFTTLTAFSAQAAESVDPESVFAIEPVAQLQRPWAMTFLPDGRLLVTEKEGRVLLLTQEGKSTEVAGAPAVDYEKGRAHV